MIKKIAVTGTKGKSTALRLLEAGFMELQYNVYGTYGVDGFYYNGNMIRDGSSSENYLEIDQGQFQTDIHLIEATSFTLDCGIFEGCELDCAIFTSFDESEHTEIHPQPGEYLKSKRKIFELLKPGAKAVVCRDMNNFSKVIEGHEDKVVSYGLHPESDYVISINMINQKKMIFSLTCGEDILFFKSKILGDFNATNIAAAYIAGLQLDVKSVPFFRGLEKFSGFDGRFERFRIPKLKTNVIIDYAHTHESLNSLLSLCKTIYPDDTLLTIFGCGGNKSTTKRPLMSGVAEKYSDFVVLTNDNPRNENPADIVADIIKGFKSDKHHVILDRDEAIKTCLSKSKGGTLVIAGKGAEKEIMFGCTTLYHSDKECLISWCIQNNLSIYKVGDEIPNE